MKSIVIYGVTRSADWRSFQTAIHNCTCVNYSTENQTSLVTDWFVLCIEWWLVAVSDGNQTIPSVPQLNTSPRGDKIVNIPTHSDQHRIGYPYFQTHTVRKPFVCGLNGGWVHRSLHAAWVFHHGHMVLPRLGPSQFAELDSRSRLLCSTLTECGHYAAQNHFRVNQNEVEKQNSESDNDLQNLYSLLHLLHCSTSVKMDCLTASIQI